MEFSRQINNLFINSGAFCLVMFFLMAVLLKPAWSDWALTYGSGKGQVGFLNGSIQKPYEESTALGPLAFRVYRDQAWVLDSLQGRILVFDKDGRLNKTINIPGLPKNSLLEDFAFVIGSNDQIESLWVADGADAKIRRIRVSDGALLAQAGGSGNQPGLLQQIHQIEVGPKGELWVGDIGRGRLLSYDELGHFCFELDWQSSGFALHPNGDVSLIDFSERVGYIWRTYDRNGRLRSAQHLGWLDYQNPRVWGLTPNGGLIVTFVPASGFRGLLKLVVFQPSGQSKLITQIAPPMAMNRFLYFVNDSNMASDSLQCGWLARADFEKAPSGRFAIVRLPLEAKP